MGKDTDISPEKEEPSKKRAREDDAATEESPLKKLDQKEEATTDSL